MSVVKSLVVIIVAGVVNGQRDAKLLTSEDWVSAVVEDCTLGDTSVTTCIRQKTLSYMNNILGVSDEQTARSFSDESLDEQLASRVAKYVKTHDFSVQLPEFLFQSAVLTFRPSRGLADFKVDFPEPQNEARADSEARGILKKKLLLPILLLLKLKLKALTPLLLVVVGIKAFKALVISKLSLLLVVGFLVVQLCKKLGMPMPMPMPAAMVTELPPVYGPGPTPAPYGAPVSTPDNSYGPWDSSSSGSSGSHGGNGGPYSRWDAHNIAYSSYQPESAKTATKATS